MQIRLSVLIPTRGRTQALKKSIDSLLDLADAPEQMEILLGMDRDDSDTIAWVQQHILPNRPQVSIQLFRRLGYQGLCIYVNTLAGLAQGDWIFAFNDDTQLETAGWDSLIYQYDDHPMPLLRIPCSNFDHEFALFPIFKREWLQVNGHLSYQIHYDRFMYNVAKNMPYLEMMWDLPATIFNDRADLTGNNQDATFAETSASYDTEGDPTDPCNDDYPANILATLHTVNKFASYINKTRNTNIPVRDISKPLNIQRRTTIGSHATVKK